MAKRVVTDVVVVGGEDTVRAARLILVMKKAVYCTASCGKLAGAL